MKYNKKFYENIVKYKMIDSEDELVVACSGGADSIFLLYNLVALKNLLNFSIKVCHVNHGIRNTAKRDQKFVEEQCIELGVPFYTINVDMNKFAKDNGMSSEEAGRFLRYEFFRKNGSKIFTAHNMNDQVETILYRIIRGTGIDGLLGIEYVNEDLYRPMLNISRQEIEEFLFENNIKYVEDETNELPIYARNKIRLELIPYIENNLNSNFKESLLRLQNLAEKQNVYFKNKIDEYLYEFLENGTLKINFLKYEDDYFISLVLREYLKRLNLLEGLGKIQIEDFVNLIKKDSAAMDIHGKIFEISQGYLYIKQQVVEVSEQILSQGVNITEFGNIIVEEGFKAGKNYIQIDKNKIKGSLRVRKKKNGDKFFPYGMKGSKKLKDFFIDEKISKFERENVPIITDEEEIIWVAPYRMSENYKVEKKSCAIISIGLEGKNE